jgi:tRNA 2-(methylsulfanyl)-N6-isopentenyladenosine37 hydroxylase
MLNLKLATDPRLVNLTEKSIEDILSDHAYCEQKAASSCISIIQKFSEKELLVEKLAPIVSEEWSHFRLVLKELKKRGLKLAPQRKDEYVNGLINFQKKGIDREEVLLERLLTAAIIEARSCERFRILSLHIGDDDLKTFYHHFMVSEAGHFVLFIELAKHYFDDDKVNERWQEYLSAETIILQNLQLRGDRVH